MRIPCRTGALLLGLLASCLTPACSPSASAPEGPEAAQAAQAAQAAVYPDPAAAELLAGVSGADPAAVLLARARTAAVRLRTDAPVEELEPLGREMRLCVQALTLLPESAALSWDTWIREDRADTPALATELLRAADHVVAPELALQLANANDRRTSALVLRLEAHRILWRLDPGFAEARARNMLFHEEPRAQDSLRPNYVAEILVPRRDAASDRLLQEIAVDDTMEPRARRLALRELGGRTVPGTAALAESIFDTEATDLMVRQEALRAIVALEPARARRVLDDKLPSPDVQPILYGFMVDLRGSMDAESDE